ncbi:M3 family metallopeptidase [Serratia ureilytica]
MAQAKEQDGWLLTLDMPSYLPVLTYADNRAARRDVPRLRHPRLRSGPNAGKWDNSEVMAETLALRHEPAQLLGFDTYADKSLATKMAESPEQVIGFLSDLAKRACLQAEQELAQLRAFAKQHHGVDELDAWTSPITAKNRSSTCSPSATSSCARTSRSSGWWKGCSKW